MVIYGRKFYAAMNENVVGFRRGRSKSDDTSKRLKDKLVLDAAGPFTGMPCRC
jgi:hypothetical protein